MNALYTLPQRHFSPQRSIIFCAESKHLRLNSVCQLTCAVFIRAPFPWCWTFTKKLWRAHCLFLNLSGSIQHERKGFWSKLHSFPGKEFVVLEICYQQILPCKTPFISPLWEKLPKTLLTDERAQTHTHKTHKHATKTTAGKEEKEWEDVMGWPFPTVAFPSFCLYEVTLPLGLTIDVCIISSNDIIPQSTTSNECLKQISENWKCALFWKYMYISSTNTITDIYKSNEL